MKENDFQGYEYFRKQLFTASFRPLKRRVHFLKQENIFQSIHISVPHKLYYSYSGYVIEAKLYIFLISLWLVHVSVFYVLFLLCVKSNFDVRFIQGRLFQQDHKHQNVDLLEYSSRAHEWMFTHWMLKFHSFFFYTSASIGIRYLSFPDLIIIC